jgi:hypothetical protein
VLDGAGMATANGIAITVDGPSCYRLISHPRSTEGRLELSVSEGVHCYAVCFTPGLAPPDQAGS